MAGGGRRVRGAGGRHARGGGVLFGREGGGGGGRGGGRIAREGGGGRGGGRSGRESGGGRGKGGVRSRRRLEDPAPAVGHEDLKKELRQTGLLDDRELETFRVPKCLKKEKPLVKQHNRGLKTIYNKMMHLRRRYARLMIYGRTSCPEADYISRKLDVFESEAMILQDKIDDLKGSFFQMPSILKEEITLHE